MSRDPGHAHTVAF
jgi:hypothetical protein